MVVPLPGVISSKKNTHSQVQQGTKPPPSTDWRFMGSLGPFPNGLGGCRQGKVAKLQEDTKAQKERPQPLPQPHTHKSILKHAGLNRDWRTPPCQHRELPNPSLRRGWGAPPEGEGVQLSTRCQKEHGRKSSNRTRTAFLRDGAPLSTRLRRAEPGAYLPASATHVSWAATEANPGSKGELAGGAERIWPVDELLGIFPDYILFSKEEERSVDSEAVLPDRNGIVQSHSPGSLRFGLLEASWGASRRGRRSLPAPVLVGAPISGAQPAGHRLPKTSHPEKKHTGEPKQHHRGGRGGRRGRGIAGAVPTTAPSSSPGDAQPRLFCIPPGTRV